MQDKSYDLMTEEVAKATNINGKIVGVTADFIVNGIDIMELVKCSELRELIGTTMYNALMRKPMMLFMFPTKEEEFDADKEILDQRYGIMEIQLNNFAQAFSIACWFVKDSCVSANYIYLLNIILGYNSQAHREMEVTLSDGTVAEITFDDAEIEEAIDRMYEIYKFLLPEESKTRPVESKVNAGTIIWEIDKAISTEGNSFARALIKLQEARRTGFVASKIDKYCSVLECLYAIKEEHKKNIAYITAAYIGKDELEREGIVTDMKMAYGIRSDSSHGDSLKYLKENDDESMKTLVKRIDDYVRRVFRKVIAVEELNYDATSQNKTSVRTYFKKIMRMIYSE